MTYEMLTARDLMSTDVESCDSEWTLIRALKHMIKLHIHCLLVHSVLPSRSMGIISIKDIVQLLGDAGPDILDELVVSEAMTAPFVSLPDYMSIPDCVNLMRMTGVRTAPVMAGSELVGLLSFTDVLCWIAENH
ncbi:MAG: CBS domain-containing protein [Myxococcota bacterium]|jgi:CBS domain-containing protein